MTRTLRKSYSIIQDALCITSFRYDPSANRSKVKKMNLLLSIHPNNLVIIIILDCEIKFVMVLSGKTKSNNTRVKSASEVVKRYVAHKVVGIIWLQQISPPTNTKFRPSFLGTPVVTLYKNLHVESITFEAYSRVSGIS